MQKVLKSDIRPKVTLSMQIDFNQVVTMDLKSIGKKRYCGWFAALKKLCLVSWFQISANIISEAMNSTWNYTIGFSLIGYFADNKREFLNVKMDELVAKLGLNIQLRPAYSSSSNGISYRNHAMADIANKTLL